MKTVTDETMMAWLDGELTPDQRDQFEAAIAASPELGLQVARLSRLERMLAPAYADTLKAPIPARFDALLSRPRASAWSLSGVRAALGGMLDVRPLGMAAAALVVGVVAGGLMLTSPQTPGFETNSDGSMIANNAMAVSLASIQSGEVASQQAVRIKLTVVDENGQFCRQFETSGASGLACLEGDKWKVDTLSPHKAAGGADQYVMAGSETDPAITAALERRGVKRVLDRAEEEAAIAAGWKVTKR